MACLLTAPSHYLKPCWLISEVPCHSFNDSRTGKAQECNYYNAFGYYTFNGGYEVWHLQIYRFIRKFDTFKSRWFPMVWCCSRNRVFVMWFANLHFCGKNYNLQRAVRSNVCVCWGLGVGVGWVGGSIKSKPFHTKFRLKLCTKYFVQFHIKFRMS